MTYNPTNITIDAGEIEHVTPLGYGEDGEQTYRREIVWTVTATSEQGHRWTGLHLFECREEALGWAALHPDPIGDFDAWGSDQPIYGSEAWDGDAEYELACFEADAFGEPRPRWWA